MNWEFRYPQTYMLLSRKYSIFRYPQATSSEPTASSNIIQKSAGGYVPRIRTNGAGPQPRERGANRQAHLYRTGCPCPSAVGRALSPRRTERPVFGPDSRDITRSIVRAAPKNPFSPHPNSSPTTQAPRTGAKTQAAAPVARCVPTGTAPKPNSIASHGVSPNHRVLPRTEIHPSTPSWHLFEPLGSQDFLK